jgi:mannose-6-phosphate isomerase-like protein (cupin superfamily)
MMNNQAAQSFPTIVSGFGYSPIGPALWKLDPVSRLEYRDLSLQEASEKRLIGRHYRAAGETLSISGLIRPNAVFEFLFLLAGHVTLMDAGKEGLILNAFDSATRYGRGKETHLSCSHDAEFILLYSTDHQQSILGDGSSESWLVRRENEDAYVTGDGPRAYFKYRDLGVSEATSRRIHIHVVRATAPSNKGGTGWHSHSMGQLFYVLRGSADVVVEFRPAVRMQSGDAMCVAPRMRHDVPSFSRDYLVLEMCIPADYDTVASDTAQDEA